jgi:acyl-coenzyme A synthetase/AMP-(fatty) acid ligase
VLVVGLRSDLSRSQYAQVARALRQVVSEENGVSPRCVVLLRARDVPRTTSGKICRGKTREAFLRGELPLLYREEFHEGVSSGLESLPSVVDGVSAVC